MQRRAFVPLSVSTADLKSNETSLFIHSLSENASPAASSSLVPIIADVRYIIQDPSTTVNSNSEIVFVHGAMGRSFYRFTKFDLSRFNMKDISETHSRSESGFSVRSLIAGLKESISVDLLNNLGIKKYHPFDELGGDFNNLKIKLKYVEDNAGNYLSLGIIVFLKVGTANIQNFFLDVARERPNLLGGIHTKYLQNRNPDGLTSLDIRPISNHSLQALLEEFK